MLSKSILKTVIDLGNSLLWLRGKPVKKGTETFKEHDLANLLPGVKDVFNLLDCADIWTPPIFRSFDDIERVVKAVNEVPHVAFRYPVDRTGRGELLPEALCFNSLTFAEKLDALLSLLDMGRRCHRSCSPRSSRDSG